MSALNRENRKRIKKSKAIGWKILSAATLAQALIFAGCGASQPPAPAPAPAPGPVVPPPPAPPPFDCQPISMATPQINFSITGGTIGQGRVRAGTIPQGNIGAGMTFGATQVLPGALPPIPSAIQLQGRREMDGSSIALQVSPPAGGGAVPNGGYPPGTVPNGGLPPGYGPMMLNYPGMPGQPTLANSMVPINFTGNGSVMISPAVIQQLLQLYGGAPGANPYMVSGYPGYPGGFLPAPGVAPQPIPPGSAPVAPGNVCVSGVAIDLNQTLYTNWLYLGSVYLYVNRSVHGLALDF